MDYKDCGVDVAAGNSFAKSLGFSGFSAIHSLGDAIKGMRDPQIVMSTDGIGTKVKLASVFNKRSNYYNCGLDLVAMVVNDIITSGATPKFFLDYYATPKLIDWQGECILEGIRDGCRQAGMELVGGETAEMPGVYEPGDFDLAGFGVGFVDQDKVIGGQGISGGDQLVGLLSNGPHANGYSLLRKLYEREINIYMNDPDSLSDSEIEQLLWMMNPTDIYVNEIEILISLFGPNVKGIAHITGGGVRENIMRATGGREISLCYPVFTDYKQWMDVLNHSDMDHYQMSEVFNMGVGMVLVIDKGVSLPDDLMVIGEVS